MLSPRTVGNMAPQQRKQLLEHASKSRAQMQADFARFLKQCGLDGMLFMFIFVQFYFVLCLSRLTFSS
jgi:hypothetical protein